MEESKYRNIGNKEDELQIDLMNPLDSFKNAL
jgi:hypothetical protein